MSAYDDLIASDGLHVDSIDRAVLVARPPTNVEIHGIASAGRALVEVADALHATRGPRETGPEHLRVAR
jgi:hypothetical protein